MFKNVASKFIVFAFNATDNTPKTGDAAQITAYVSKDYGTVTVLGDTSATEMDATNAPGYYLFDAAQAETNGDCLMVSGKSSTANIKVIGAPAVIYTRPTTGWLAPTTAARTLDVSAGGEAGVDWANVGSPTTALALTGTTIAVTQKVDVDTIKTNPVVNGGTITFPTTATLASTTNITAGTIATVTNLTNAPGAGDFTAVMKTSIGTAVAASAVASVTARVTANTDQLAGQTVTAAAGVTFPTSVASPTNITAGTITNATNVTNGVTVTTNNDKTGYALSAAGNAAVADKLLGRNLAGGSDGTRTVQDALRILRNKASIAAGTLTVTAEDDTTPAWTAAVVTTAGDPISSIDPV